MIKKLTIKIITLIVFTGLIFALSCVLHECGHWLSAKIIYLTNGTINLIPHDGMITYTPNVYIPATFDCMGGYFSALVLLLLLIFKLSNSYKMVIIAVVIEQLAGGTFEGFIPHSYSQTNLIMIVTMFITMGLFGYIWIVKKDITRESLLNGG